MTVNILGTEYTINKYNYTDIPIFEKRSLNGYQDGTTKEIAIVNMNTYPGYEDETEEYAKIIEKETLRHEIIHAFFDESGLRDSSCRPSGGWSKNEEMVDWIAIQFPKIQKAFESVDAL